MDDTGPYKTAFVTYRKGLEHDPENEELKDGERRARDALEQMPQDDAVKEMLERVMMDPEINDIMSDPAMSPVLAEFHNPAALAAHMKNPELAAKVQKLVDAGMLKL